MGFLYAAVVLLATTIGAVSGIGGGVIIKPVLDAIGFHTIADIGFLSSCSVFAMALVSSYTQIRQGVRFDCRVLIFDSIGAVAGGFAGNSLFSLVSGLCGEKPTKLLQSSLLAFITLLVLMYILMQKQVKGFEVKNPVAMMFTGLMLGIISSFLGIGGGPFNVAVFMLFFAMDMKSSTVYSVAVIIFSQLSNLTTLFAKTGFQEYDAVYLLYMIPAAVIGGYIGAKLNKKMSEGAISLLFNLVLLFIIGLNLYNVAMALITA